MSDSVVAYRYAKSLVDLASERGVVEEVSNDMELFKKVNKENREFMKVMANPIVRHDIKLKVLKKVFENNVHPVTFSILTILTKKHRESLLVSIADEFQKLYNEHRNIKVASVTTVEPLTDQQREDFKKIVSTSTGSKVKLEEKTDDSLIGGYILKVGDSQVDTSIKKKLNDLKLSLN